MNSIDFRPAPGPKSFIFRSFTCEPDVARSLLFDRAEAAGKTFAEHFSDPGVDGAPAAPTGLVLNADKGWQEFYEWRLIASIALTAEDIEP